MVQRDYKAKIQELTAPLVEAEGFELIYAECLKMKSRWMVRIFLDKEGGVTLDDCAEISNQLGDILDVHDVPPGQYTLEVSSPGLDRPLKSMVDFKYRIGETIRVEFEDADKKKLTAEIIGVKDNEVELKDEEKTLVVPLSEIKQAKIVF